MSQKKYNLISIVLFLLLMVSLAFAAIGMMNKDKGGTTPVTPEPDETVTPEPQEDVVDVYGITLTNVQETFQKAQEKWVTDSQTAAQAEKFSYCRVGGCENSLDGATTDMDYLIEINEEGKVVKYYATNDTYQFKYEGEGIAIEEISLLDEVSLLEPEAVITITPGM